MMYTASDKIEKHVVSFITRHLVIKLGKETRLKLMFVTVVMYSSETWALARRNDEQKTQST